MLNVCVMLQGGLGNQCFEYAAGRALALKARANLTLRLDYLAEDRIYNRKLELDAFKCEFMSVLNEIKIARYFERVRNRLMGCCAWRIGNFCCDRPPYVYRELPSRWAGTLTLDGYWQSEKYFWSIRKQLIDEFQLKESRWMQSDHMAGVIQNAENPIFLHVRSYKEVPGKKDGCCALRMRQYYENALAYFCSRVGKSDVFVFSDDIEWAKGIFLRSWESRFSRLKFSPIENGSSPIREFMLMRLCKHGIVADSSFSWWAGWLGEQEWLARGEMPIRIRVNRRVMNDDFWPERWIPIDES